jgi:hypothetical protein
MMPSMASPNLAPPCLRLMVSKVRRPFGASSVRRTMKKFPIDKYSSDTRVKWIVAQRIDGGEWQGILLSVRGEVPTFERALDEIPRGELLRSELGIFRNRLGIGENRPRYYWRGREVPTFLAPGLCGLINSRSSDYF